MTAHTSWYNIWRLFITNAVWQALTMALLASVLAEAVWILAPLTSTALDWTLYDTWVRVRGPIAASERR